MPRDRIDWPPETAECTTGERLTGSTLWPVTPVILFLAELYVFPGGYVGVDVFFVISGFLFTMILLEERAADWYSLAWF
jgi:peptidoglycan/LPS O-acetylase OafA/YrhL